MTRLPGPMRGPYLDFISSFAPILFGVLFVIVLAALLRNCIDSRVNPQSQRPMPTDIRQINAAQAVRLIAGSPKRNQSE